MFTAGTLPRHHLWAFQGQLDWDGMDVEEEWLRGTAHAGEVNVQQQATTSRLLCMTTSTAAMGSHPQPILFLFHNVEGWGGIHYPQISRQHCRLPIPESQWQWDEQACLQISNYSYYRTPLSQHAVEGLIWYIWEVKGGGQRSGFVPSALSQCCLAHRWHLTSPLSANAGNFSVMRSSKSGQAYSSIWDKITQAALTIYIWYLVFDIWRYANCCCIWHGT